MCSSLMKTSPIAFCDIHVELLLEHQVKESILNEILHLCNLKFQDVYYSKITQQNSGLIRQPHFLSLLSKGRPYWMYCTKIEGKEYCVLIEKFLKPGYPYPKMILGKFIFDPSVYTNTLFECELTKVFTQEKEWVLLIQDMHIYQNSNMRNIDPITRYNQLHYIFTYHFTEDYILQPCALQLKQLFSSKDISDLKRLCRELPYQIQGILFTPYNTQYDVLYWEDTHHQLQRNRHPVTPNNQRPPSVKPTPIQPPPPPETECPEPPSSHQIFSIRKCSELGVYTIVNGNEVENKLLHIQGINASKKMKQLFQQNEILEFPCQFNADFQKWEPVLTWD